MTLVAIGAFVIAFGGGLLLFRRPLTRWNARAGDAMKAEHIRQISEPNDGAPEYIVGVGALILTAGGAMVLIGAIQA